MELTENDKIRIAAARLMGWRSVKVVNEEYHKNHPRFKQLYGYHPAFVENPKGYEGLEYVPEQILPPLEE